MLNVALTGNIASGKSTVADAWRKLGATIIDADELSRRAVRPGSRALERIVEIWGPTILLPTGELDRVAMRDLVFRDASERKKLEVILHPEIRRLRDEELREAEARGVAIVVSDIPLLYESGLEHDFDVVVLVISPTEQRRDRLTGIRGIDIAEAQRMIDSQMSAELKRGLADIVIQNEGPLSELQRAAEEVWANLTIRAGQKLESQ